MYHIVSKEMIFKRPRSIELHKIQQKQFRISIALNSSKSKMAIETHFKILTVQRNQ